MSLDGLNAAIEVQLNLLRVAASPKLRSHLFSSSCKVAFIVTGLETGGAEMMLYKVLRHSRLRYNACVIALRDDGRVGDLIRELGVDVHVLGMRPHLPALSAMRRLAQALRKCSPHVVSTWMYHADLLGGLCARSLGLPVVWGIRNGSFDTQSVKWQTRLVIRACAVLSRVIPARIICCSSSARDFHVGVGYAKSKFQVIPNGFDLQIFMPSECARADVRQELGLGPACLLVGYVGRWDPQKNVEGFLRMAQIVLTRLPLARFVMVGNGLSGINCEFQAAVRELGLEGVLHGLGPRSDVPRLMASLDVLASSSHSEAFSNVIGEAMSCGVPCAVTDVGDSAAIIEGCGEVAARSDMEGLAEGVVRILSLSPEARRELGATCRRKVESSYEIGRVASMYESSLTDVTNFGGLAFQ